MKVSACIITYNQEKFINECLEGAISQLLNHNYEIVIGDDCSNDNTFIICQKYKEKYPNLIKYYRREQNLGMMGNWIETIKNCTGKYIALCEGDDYWTDPYKLQKQVDFLDANEEYSLCGHHSSISESGEIRPSPLFVPSGIVTAELLIDHNPFMTASVVFRRSILPLPDWFVGLPLGDYGIYFWASKHGILAWLPDNMCVYRRHAAGIHAPLHQSEEGLLQVWKKHSDFYLKIKKELFKEDKKIQHLLNLKMKACFNEMKTIYRRNNDFLAYFRVWTTSKFFDLKSNFFKC